MNLLSNAMKFVSPGGRVECSLKRNGQKVALRKFVSAKKTLNATKVAKIVSKTARPADDKRFHAFRKESYYETVASIKDLKMRQAEEEATRRADEEAQEKASRFAKAVKKSQTNSYGN